MSDHNNLEKRKYKVLEKYHKKNLQDQLDQQDDEDDEDEKYHKVAKKRQPKYNNRLLIP
ncbi:MAG: hypothetical protein ACJA0E_000315 [Bermanella sp.]|jgi:hypothetical protein